jgi:hypothetical protein
VDPAQDAFPVIAADQDHGEIVDLVRLDEGQRFEHLVEGAVPPGKDDVAAGVFHEHHLAREEIVEMDERIDVAVRLLLEGEPDVETDGVSAAAARAEVRRLHDSGPSAGDDREPLSGQGLGDLHRLAVVLVSPPDARSAENGDRRLHAPQGLEALDKLPHDLEDGPGILGDDVLH